MAKKIYRTVLLLCILGVMVFIYCNSAKNAVQSSDVSAGITEKVVPIVVPDFEYFGEEKKVETIKSFNAGIRVFAHATEYAALAFFVFIFISTYDINKFKLLLTLSATMLYCFLYALTDEWHQSFVPGRAAEWFDIGIDSLGMAVGCLCAWIVEIIKNAVIKKRCGKSI